MKRFFAGALTLLLLLPLLTACGGSMRYTEAGVYKKGNQTYRMAPSAYEPRAYLASAKVGVLQRANMKDTPLYQVSGTEGETWLCDKELSMLFYAEGETLPTLAQLCPTALHLQLSDVLSLGLGTIEDSAEIAKVVASCTTGVSFLLEDVEAGNTYDRYEVKFASPLYPAFYYTMVYLRYASEVLIYEAVEDPTNFVPSYPGVEVTTEDYYYNAVENGTMVSKVEHLAVYHFGRDILYDMESGRCYLIGTDRLGDMVDSFQ